MPVLARMVATPLCVEVGSGAVARLAPLLTDRRISREGHIALVVGPGLGSEVITAAEPGLSNAQVFQVDDGALSTATRLAASFRGGSFDAVVGVGGGRTLDVAKHAATQVGLPMVSVATSLAHDGLASPVASLEGDGHKGSYGVQMPIAVIVDLDFVARSPIAMRRSGIGDALSNMSALADWRLASDVFGEEVDGLAAAFASTASEAVLGHDSSVDDPAFLATLADSLILSGLAMAVAGSSRPCSGGEHEIVHAIDRLFPATASHGELVGLATLFCTHLRDDAPLFAQLGACLRRHGLPRRPAEIGLSDVEFAAAVALAPSTRPDRFTILEQLEMDETEVARSTASFTERVESEPLSPEDGR